jgi:hypothetical protein
MDYRPISAKEQESAISALEIRRSDRPKQKDNASLHAGSMMYYYCRMCGHESDVRGEGDFSPVRHYCNSCEKMRTAGWVDDEKRFVECKVMRCDKCEDGEIHESRTWYFKPYIHTRRCETCKGTSKILVRVDTNEPVS